MKRYLLSLLFVASTVFGVGANKVWRVGTSNGYPSFGAVNLASSSAVTNQLSVANGGTGAATLTGVLIGNGTSAVTALNPLTRAYLPAVGAQSVTGSFTNTAYTTYEDAFSVSLTTTGRPVVIGIQPKEGTDSFGSIHFGISSGGCTTANIKILRDATTLYEVSVSSSTSGSNLESFGRVVKSYIDLAPSAASHTYKLQLYTNCGSGAKASITDATFYAFEM